jgi:hypothetical protein
MYQTDSHEPELEQALRRQFHERYGDPPSAAPLWSQLSAHLASQESGPTRQDGPVTRRFRIPMRTGSRLSARQSIALGLFLVVAIGAASYSASILLHPLLQVPAAAERVYTHVNQTRTLGEITITVEQGVADRDWIIIGVSAERPCLIPSDACYYDLAAPSLATQDGQELKAKAILSDSAYRPGKQEAAYVYFFKPPQLNSQTTSLTLHLELRLVGESGQPVGDAAIFDFTLPNHVGASS